MQIAMFTPNIHLITVNSVSSFENLFSLEAAVSAAFRALSSDAPASRSASYNSATIVVIFDPLGLVCGRRRRPHLIGAGVVSSLMMPLLITPHINALDIVTLYETGTLLFRQEPRITAAASAPTRLEALGVCAHQGQRSFAEPAYPRFPRDRPARYPRAP